MSTYALPYPSAWALKKSVHSQFSIVQIELSDVKCRVLTPTSLHWQAGLTCLFTPQNSTVNSYILVWVSVTYYVILVSYIINSRVNPLSPGLDGTSMTISVGKHQIFPMWTSGRALFLYPCMRWLHCLLDPPGSPAAANGVVCSPRFFLIC